MNSDISLQTKELILNHIKQATTPVTFQICLQIARNQLDPTIEPYQIADLLNSLVREYRIELSDTGDSFLPVPP